MRFPALLATVATAVAASIAVSVAAKLLGIPCGQFYSLLRRHGLADARR